MHRTTKTEYAKAGTRPRAHWIYKLYLLLINHVNIKKEKFAVLFQILKAELPKEISEIIKPEEPKLYHQIDR